MRKSFRIVLALLLFIAAVSLSVFYIASNNIAVLEPKGFIGIKERDLIITASLLMLVVVIPVFILTGYFAWKYRKENEKARHEPDWEHNNIAECCWWGVPFVIIIILAVITYTSSHKLNPFKPLESEKKPLVIQAVALQWKWLFIYPEEGIATINYLQFPEKTPLNFEITADAPMNSFWIPQLGGQIYAMPAMRSKLHLIAEETGTFAGRSANLSGSGFAGMTFTAKATTAGEYEEWISTVKGSGKSLSWEKYEELVKPSSYSKAELFRLADKELFNQIIEQYMSPSQENQKVRK